MYLYYGFGGNVAIIMFPLVRLKKVSMTPESEKLGLVSEVCSSRFATLGREKVEREEKNQFYISSSFHMP